MEIKINYDKIEKYIKDHELTPENFAKYANITIAELYALYTSPNIFVLFKIAKSMGIAIDELIISD